MQKSREEFYADALSRSFLFKDVPRELLEELARPARARHCRRKEEVFHKGDEGTDTFVVVEGSLKAFTTSSDGDDVVFSILGPGEVFGEIAMLAAMPRTATISALEDCELLVLDRRDLLDFLRRHPQASLGMLGMLARRLIHVSELVEDTLFLNLPVRLAKKLVSMSHIYGRPGDHGVKIDLKLSQAEWGDLVGTTRESINKQLGVWTREGLVSLESGYVVIHELDELERLADALFY